MHTMRHACYFSFDILQQNQYIPFPNSQFYQLSRSLLPPLSDFTLTLTYSRYFRTLYIYYLPLTLYSYPLPVLFPLYPYPLPFTFTLTFYLLPLLFTFYLYTYPYPVPFTLYPYSLYLPLPFTITFFTITLYRPLPLPSPLTPHSIIRGKVPLCSHHPLLSAPVQHTGQQHALARPANQHSVRAHSNQSDPAHSSAQSLHVALPLAPSIAYCIQFMLSSRAIFVLIPPNFRVRFFAFCSSCCQIYR